MLTGFLKRFWRFIQKTLFMKIITWSLVYFVVLMLISYNHFYYTDYTINLCSVDVSISFNSTINGLSINILIIAAGYLVRFRNMKKSTCWCPKVVVILVIRISCFFLLINLFSLNFWANWKMILVSKFFLVVLPFYFVFHGSLKPHDCHNNPSILTPFHYVTMTQSK